MSDTVLITDIQDNEPVGFHPDMGAVRQMLQNAQDSKARCCLSCGLDHALHRPHSATRQQRLFIQSAQKIYLCKYILLGFLFEIDFSRQNIFL